MPMSDRMNTRIDINLKKKALNVFDRLGLVRLRPTPKGLLIESCENGEP